MRVFFLIHLFSSSCPSWWIPFLVLICAICVICGFPVLLFLTPGCGRQPALRFSFPPSGQECYSTLLGLVDALEDHPGDRRVKAERFGDFALGELDALLAEGERSLDGGGASGADETFDELRRRSAERRDEQP